MTAWTPFEPAAGADPVGDSPCFLNSRYQVTLQDYASGWTHLSIIRRDREAVHDWRDLQRIKNELCHPEREAVELFPAESRLVDSNNQFHLWVAPPGVTLPIGYMERDISDRPFGAHKQRPFEQPPDDLNAVARGPVDYVKIMLPPAAEVVEQQRRQLDELVIPALVNWLEAEARLANEEGRCSARELMGFIYSEWDEIHGEYTAADEMLTKAGLLAPPADRTEHCETWKTPLGVRVAAALDFRPSV